MMSQSTIQSDKKSSKDFKGMPYRSSMSNNRGTKKLKETADKQKSKAENSMYERDLSV